APAALTANTWYKRVVTSGACANDTTAAIAITVGASGTWTGVTSNAWGNTANWSCPLVPTSSTNVTIPSGTPNSPVITDAQQANNVTINTGATLTLNNVNAILSVFGSITNNGTFTNTSGKLNMAGSSAQTLIGGTYSDLQVNNPNGVTLGGNVTLNDSLVMVNGLLTLGANSLTMGNTSLSSAGNTASYVRTNSTGRVIVQNVGTAGKTGNVIIPVGNTTYNPVVLANAGTADTYTVWVIDSVTANYSGSTPSGLKLTTGAVNRTWFINETVAGGSIASVTLQWNTADELSAFNRASSYVSRYTGTGTAWSNNTATAAAGSNPYTQVRAGITSFSPFGVGSGTTLPVQLISFTGMKKAKLVELSWSTASEINNDHFIIERSTDNRSFEPIGTVKGHGNSNSLNTYNLADDITALISQRVGTVYYRLTQVDVNGRKNDGGQVALGIAETFSGITVTAQPNPFSSSVSLSVNSGVEEHVTIRVTDLAGRLVSFQTAQILTGDNQIQVQNLDDVKDGVYFINLTTSNGIITRKVVKGN
ncbi:MAG: T9SS type A sorting domain-containing protein, partial [Bacteroidota bacterium]